MVFDGLKETAVVMRELTKKLDGKMSEYIKLVKLGRLQGSSRVCHMVVLKWCDKQWDLFNLAEISEVVLNFKKNYCRDPGLFNVSGKLHQQSLKISKPKSSFCG